jgi:Spy/CpxP family protein refolding chaperone
MKRIVSIVMITSLLGLALGGATVFGAQNARKQATRQDKMEQGMDRPGRSDGPDGQMPVGGLGMGLPLQGLDLSDEQRAQIQQAQRDFQTKTAALEQQLQFAQEDLQAEITNETTDQAKVDGLLQQLATIKGQLAEAQTEHLLAVRGVLTPEQIAQLDTVQIRIPKQANLSAEQQTKLAAILKASAATLKGLRQELQDLREQAREMVTAPELDAAQLKALQGQITEKETALEKARVDQLLQIKTVLTPEQFKQLNNRKRFQPKFQGPPPNNP